MKCACGEKITPARVAIGYTSCLYCGEQAAKQARAGWCVAQEYNKGGYMLITNPETLKQTNPKRTM
jgi:hypothetical protein